MYPYKTKEQRLKEAAQAKQNASTKEMEKKAMEEGLEAKRQRLMDKTPSRFREGANKVKDRIKTVQNALVATKGVVKKSAGLFGQLKVKKSATEAIPKDG